MENNKITPEILLITLALSIGSFMNVLDSTIVNVSLSHIAGDFGISPNQGTWVITSYSVAEAIFLPLIGWLTTRFGSVKQYIWSTILFTIASMICGLAPTYPLLLFARVMQGVVGASMIPLSQTIMLSVYPKAKKGLGLGIWAMTIVIAPVLGPILGGWITDTMSWRWCFYVNLPFGILSSYLVYTAFKKRGHKDIIQHSKIDFIGLILLIIGVGSLQLMLDKGSELDWFSSSTVVFLAIMAFVFLVVLVIWEFYQKNPIVNVRLFLNRNFVAGSVSLMVASVVFVGGIVIIPLWLQNSMGYTSFTSGQTTATSGILVIFLAPIIGANIHKFDARKLTVFGFVTFSIISIGLSQYSTDTTQGYIALTRFLTGGALAFFFLPLNTITLSEIDDKDMTSASGLYNFMRNIGNSVGVSLSVSLWQNKIAEHHEILTSNITTSNPIYMNYLNKIPNGTPANTASLFDGLISQQAVVMAVNDVMQVSGIIILLLIPFIKKKKKPSKAVAMGH